MLGINYCPMSGRESKIALCLREGGVELYSAMLKCIVLS